MSPSPGTLIVPCPGCGKRIKAKEELAGKKVKCPGCGTPLVISSETLPTRGGETPPQQHENTASQPTTGGEGHSQSEPSWDFLAPAKGPGELGWLGPYRILKVLGHGGMGVVFKAEDPQLKRTVALKAMLPALAASGSAKQRFLREAQAAAALKHDHIVAIYQVGEDRGAPYLAMEFLEGEPLDVRIKREGTLPPTQVAEIGRQVAEGLAAAHTAGLIHRDIKPGNIWLESVVRRQSSAIKSKSGSDVTGQRSTDYRVKILDFGLARSADDQAHLTQSGAIVGTPAYMPPEQARGEKVDRRCDLFSLGAVLYKLATGKLPFEGKGDTLSILTALALDTPKDPSELNPQVPPGLNRIIMHLLEKDPEKRPANAEELADTLAEIDWNEATPPKQTPKKQPAKVQSNAKTSKLPLLVGGSVGAILVLGLLAWFLWPRGQNTNVAAPKEPPTKGPPAAVAASDGLFNGKDLTGWGGLPGLWSWKDGVLVGASTAPVKFNTFLVSEREFGDFELAFQAKVRQGCNSGIQVRSSYNSKPQFILAGPQLDMGANFWGCLYGERAGGMIAPADQQKVLTVLKPNDFNDYFIRCVGKRVTIKINGLTTVDDHFTSVPDRGFIGFQMHSGGPFEASFKNIQFRELGKEIVLFDGTDTSAWTNPSWVASGGAMTVGQGNNTTKASFGSCKLHLEFWLPKLPPEVKGQGRGNSGVYLQSQYEVQILDSFGIHPPSKGDCAAVYGVAAPTSNVCTPPETWQTFDITFIAPKTEKDFALITVVHNGVLVVDRAALVRPTTGATPLPPGPAPLMLQQHGNPVRFRNIRLTAIE